MGASSDTGFHIFMALLGLYFVGQLVWSLRDIAKIPKTPKIAKPKSDNSDIRLMWSSYRAARLNGGSISESIQSATDVVTEFNKTGRIAGVGDRPVSPPVPAVTPAARITSISHAIFINAVTVVGVFRLRWPVGTALALYGRRPSSPRSFSCCSSASGATSGRSRPRVVASVVRSLRHR